MKIIYYLLFLLPSILKAQDSKPELAFDFLSKYPNTRDITLSQDGKEAYFTIQSPMEEKSVIAYSKLENKIWSEPQLTSFSGKYRDLEPFLSSDGLKLYFASNRPIISTIDTIKDFDIWYVERKTLKDEWSSPINLGITVNSTSDEFYPSLTKTGNLYFTSNGTDSKGQDDIYFCKWNNNKYESRISLNDSINSLGFEFNAFVSSDESYLIFTGYNRLGGSGSGDLYISYNKNGIWSKAVNMGEEINSTAMDYCPFYDTNNKTLYFTSRRSEMNYYWSEEYKNLSDFYERITQPENGWSRIYNVKDFDIKLFK